MHAHIPAAFSLFFLTLSFFLSIIFLFLISNYYLAVGCFSHLGLFPFGPPLLVLTTLLLWVFSLRCLRPLGSPSFSVFLSSPVFPLIPSLVPFFLPWLPSFYSKLIPWDFSLLPLGIHQLFLVCCGHPLKITHLAIGCPYHCSVHVCCNATHFTTKFPFVLFLLYTSTSK